MSNLTQRDLADLEQSAAMETEAMGSFTLETMIDAWRDYLTPEQVEEGLRQMEEKGWIRDNGWGEYVYVAKSKNENTKRRTTLKLRESKLRRIIRRVIQESTQQIPDYMQRSFQEYGSFLKSYAYMGQDLGTELTFVSTSPTEYGEATKVKFVGGEYEPSMTIYENPEEGYIMIEWDVNDSGMPWETETDWSSTPEKALSDAMLEITSDQFIEWLAENIGDEETLERRDERIAKMRSQDFADSIKDIDLQAHPYALD